MMYCIVLYLREERRAVCKRLPLHVLLVFEPTRHEAEDHRVVKWLVLLNGQIRVQLNLP